MSLYLANDREVAKDFKQFIQVLGMTRVRTSPNRSKGECIRPGTPLSLDDARRLVNGYVDPASAARFAARPGLFSRHRGMRLVLAALLALSASAASFDVATIKRNPDCRNSQRRPSPGRLDFTCVSVRELLVISYGSLRDGAMHIGTIRILAGPGWIDTERYDLSAKSDSRPSVEEMIGPMLIELLQDRLQLKAHTEPRDTPVFALTLADGPRKLQPAPEGSCKPVDLENLPKPGDQTRYCGHGPSRFESGAVIADWYGITMAELAARVLLPYVGRLVVDRTALTGRFDIHLEFRRAPAIRADGVSTEEPVSAAPLIFDALQQRLGLKLTPTTAPIGVVVIDSIQRPSEN